MAGLGGRRAVLATEAMIGSSVHVIMLTGVHDSIGRPPPGLFEKAAGSGTPVAGAGGRNLKNTGRVSSCSTLPTDMILILN